LGQKFPDKKAEIEKLFKRCRGLNDHRVRIAHGLWMDDAHRGLIARHLSRQSLKPEFYYEDPDIAGLWRLICHSFFLLYYPIDHNVM
jgi:hypothetical protein